MISQLVRATFPGWRLARKVHQLLPEHLKVSEKCQNQIRNKLLPKNKLLRLAVKGGEGCDGFTYEFKAETIKEVLESD